MKIVVVGLGYVGISNAVLLAQHNEVIGVDISKERVNALNARKSPIKDADIEEYLTEKKLNLTASTDLKASVKGADYIIVSTPTDYDENTNFFDTSSVEFVIENVTKCEPAACIVVKSTIPVGFIEDVSKRFATNNVIFSPEFLREGKALHDNLYPSRIIIGEKSTRAGIFSDLLVQGAIKKNVDRLFTSAREAESIKLFSNTYLAMRVAFFNELDSYALSEKMDSREIIKGVSLDPRIGDHYNNPSIGYGGYCLPKDSKQLLANYKDIPQNLIHAIIDSNSTRTKFLAEQIIKKQPKILGIYKLAMKAGSDNFRQSSTITIIKHLKEAGLNVIIYDPFLTEDKFLDCDVEKNLSIFKDRAEIIVANRVEKDISDVEEKVFTRDLFGNN